MTELTKKTCCTDQDILARIESEFELIEGKDWYQLFQNKVDNSYW